jgi:hypothetical protein
MTSVWKRITTTSLAAKQRPVNDKVVPTGPKLGDTLMLVGVHVCCGNSSAGGANGGFAATSPLVLAGALGNW